MNIPYLIFNFIEYIIILPIIFIIFVKYLAERKGWDSPYEKTYSFVSVESIFYFTLLILIIELPDYLQIIDIDFFIYLSIAFVLILIADGVFAFTLIKIIYKKEIRESFFFTLIIMVFKFLISLCVGLLLSPLGIVIQYL
ncbi:hypothetical protein LCGC14_2008700 [marine sediment metagenome]|uniref:Uncharacterized protein n=1 Tax=marine sediment metagenome TaxID=412755 RepID=A0A0F9HY16_9ZZZZ